MKNPTYNELLENGTKLEGASEGTCYLYSYRGINYVVLSDNSIITQEEDNEFNDPIFPITQTK